MNIIEWVRLLWRPKLCGRSPRWREVRNLHLEYNPVCVVCLGDRDLEVHHIKPVHVDPSLELDPNNLMTLCRRHHFAIGHLENWRRYNPDVLEDAYYWAGRLAKAGRGIPK